MTEAEAVKEMRQHYTTGFKDEGRGHEPRNVGSAQELEEDEEANSPLALSGGTQTCWHLDFGSVGLILDF